MPSVEKTIHYTTTNSYSTLNSLSDTTENIWVVLHGIGYLSRYFLRHFEGLPADKNYIIAPQAPSKYYLGKAYTHVGASWLTQEDTQQEIKNVMTYLDAIMVSENIPVNSEILLATNENPPSTSENVSGADENIDVIVKKPAAGHKLIVFGFSQGVSIATRWIAQRKIECHQLVLYAGGIPNELRPPDFEFLRKNGTQVKILVGDQDEYLNEERRKSESEKIERLFGGQAKTTLFEGGHEMNRELIKGLVQ